MKKRVLLMMASFLLLMASAVHASGEAAPDVFEAKRSGVRITIPEEYKTLKGAVMFDDFGDVMMEGKGITMAGATYFPMAPEELDRLMKEAEEAEMQGDKETTDRLYEQMNGKSLIRIYAINDGRGYEELLEGILPDYERFKDDYSEEEYKKLSAEELALNRSCLYKEIGTSDGFTYFLMADNPDMVKKEGPFPGYEDGYFEEYLSLLEDYGLLADHIELTGSVKLTVRVEFPAEGTGIAFETKDLDGHTVSSAELFAGHTITMINLWATWCGPCRSELPELEELNQALADQNCQIIGIVTDADKEKKIKKAKEILEENGVSYLNLVPFEGEDDMLPQDCWPTTYFVDENGLLIGEPIRGAAPGIYREAFDRLLQDR